MFLKLSSNPQEENSWYDRCVLRGHSSRKAEMLPAVCHALRTFIMRAFPLTSCSMLWAGSSRLMTIWARAYNRGSAGTTKPSIDWARSRVERWESIVAKPIQPHVTTCIPVRDHPVQKMCSPGVRWYLLLAIYPRVKGP
jgi:hypothetical protein